MAVATRSSSRRSTTVAVLPVPFGVGFLLGGTAAIFSWLIGVLDRSESSSLQWPLLGVGVFSVAIAFVFTRFTYSGKVMPVAAMSMLVAGWLGLSASALMAFVVTGELSGAGDALFETVSATTTTGFTTFADPQELPVAVRMLRVSTQWVSGLGVLIAGMGLLPAAVSGVELTPNRPLARSKRIVTSVSRSVRNIVGLYLFLAASVAVGFLVAGMSWFDAISYGLSTSSTGGFANHAESIGVFDSAWIELIATAGMIAAGGNLVIVWWAFRGASKSVVRSTELRLYGSLLVLVTAITWIAGKSLSILDAAFATASMLSTTGLRGANWANSGGFVQAALLICAGVGAMSGSVGSGFRLARVARVALEVRRSLRLLLYPHRVEIIRIDGVAVDEASLERTYGYLWIHLLTLAVLAAFVDASNFDVIGTLTFSLSMVSNVGIVLDGERLGNFVELSGWSQLVSSAGMILGRLSIYPVLITAAGFVRWLDRFRPHRAAGSNR